MKRTLAVAFSVFIAASIITVIAIPSGATGPMKSANPTTSIPDSVGTILQKSCYPCHASPGNGMAMSHVNFDKWDAYSPEKQAGKAKDIYEEISKASMPPKSFRKNNPGKIPVAADVQVIENWANSFPGK